ncbi:hypothetical protein [Aeromicrobium sp. IC_218]|uniref:hypothetical protein n=1 Tax=Aeromicrobium sp. IC_218 TaxID=2545468 RepID=UPI00103E18C3|nr:hypothetical protein [Aeromicrobium sp. IC_218]TCJ00341.1 hypothetical protein E0W78_03900 [Aeromicrobium sp. IC_218]
MSVSTSTVRSGTRMVVGTLVLAGLVLGGVVVAVLVWAAPRHQVPLPGPDAGPREVAEAFVEAVAARDFDTARAIDATGDEDYGRFSRPAIFRDVTWGETTDDGETATVSLEADLEGGDGGPVHGGSWTFSLERYADGRWRLVGVGGGVG